MTKTPDRNQCALDLGADFAPPQAAEASPFGSFADFVERTGQNVWGCDLGDNNWNVTRNGVPESHQKLSLSDFPYLAFAERGDVLLIENAHMQPQKEEGSRSLAQAYTYAELLKIKERAEDKGLKIRLVPHVRTYQIRKAALGTEKKDDLNDSLAVSYFALLPGGIEALQKFNPRRYGAWSKKEHYAFKTIKEMNEALNDYRIHKRAKDLNPDELPAFKPMMDAFISLSRKLEVDKTQEALDAREFLMDEKKTTLVSLWIAVCDKEGNLRKFAWSDQPLGLNYIWKYLLGNKPCHFRAGVARSNLWHWTFRTSIVKKRVEPDGRVSANPNDSYRIRMVEERQRFRRACFFLMRAIQQHKLGL